MNSSLLQPPHVPCFPGFRHSSIFATPTSQLPQSIHLFGASLSPQQSHLASPSDRSMFIFGIGYVGLALARFLHKQKWDISGTCSSAERRDALEAAGLRTFRFNSDNDGEGLEQEGLQALRDATHMIITVPPVADFDNDPVLFVYRQQIAHIVRYRNLCWIGYLSSTGVYGDYRGEWVDENTQPKASDKRCIARLKAEREWLQLGTKSGACVQIFRLGGIYGPGRSAINTLLRSDKASLKQRARRGRQFTSRIHVDDICRVIMASIQSPSPGRIYNVVDSEPAPSSEVFSYARGLIMEKWPSELVQATEVASAEAAVCQDENGQIQRYPEKRVCNTRLKEDLKVELLYPSYKSGLKAVIEKLSSLKGFATSA